MNKEIYTLITGASTGFGKSLALECASRKMNLVIVALPGPELNELADFIRSTYAVKVFTFAKDLSLESECFKLHSEITALNLSINTLINNAGMVSTYIFHEGEIAFIEKQIKLNVLSITLLSHLFLEKLKQCSQSYILNVSSLSTFYYLPHKSVYAASKAYVYSLSKTIRKELKPFGISVSVICPGGMNTNADIIKVNKRGSWFVQQSVMNPDKVAPIAIDGMLKGKEVIIPGKLNNFFKLLDFILPSSLKKIIIRSQMKKLYRK